MSSFAPLESAWMSDLGVTRLTVELAPDEPWRPGVELANTLRGALGLAVREVACVVHHGVCEGCREAADCPVPAWFEGPPGAPRPFALRAAWAVGETACADLPLHLTLTFFGRLPRPSLVIEALRRMARTGLGPARVPHRIVHAVAEGLGAPVTLTPDNPIPIWPEPAPLVRFVRLPSAPCPARVDLVTRMDLGSQVGDREPQPADLLKAAILRVRKLTSAQGLAQPPRWPDPATAGGRWLELRWEGAPRFSKRQGRKMPLEGWLGRVEFEAEAIAPFAALLAAAEVVQIGKKTSFGLGCLAVRWNA